MLVAIAFSALLALAPQSAATGQTAASASQSPSAPATQGGNQRQASSTPDPNQVICRREHVVGSNRPQRICRQRREWDAIRDGGRDAFDRLNQPEVSSSPMD